MESADINFKYIGIQNTQRCKFTKYLTEYSSIPSTTTIIVQYSLSLALHITKCSIFYVIINYIPYIL